jgi:hypothetical protein
MGNENRQMSESAYFSPVTISTSEAEPSWFALGEMARHEKTVARLFSNKGYETSLPLNTRQHLYASGFQSFALPLFPSNVFCRFYFAAGLPVPTTPGGLRVMGAGRIPAPVNDSNGGA